MALSATIAAAVAGQVVRAALLARFDFVSGTERVWAGEYTLTTSDGYEWKGMGKFGSVDGLSARTDLAADQLTFALSGVDADLVGIAKNSAAEVRGQPCYVYIQFFDESWAVLDAPFPIRYGIMDQMRYAATGPSTRKITLTAEGIFAARNSAPYAYYTDSDQKARHAGDTFLALITTLQAKQITWPDY